MTKFTIKEIKEKLSQIHQSDDPFLQSLQKDSRIGVQKAISAWKRNHQKQKDLVNLFQQMNSYEEKISKKGYLKIFGIDEVGRGPLAGPVVAACVLLDPEKPIYGLKDSKVLSEKKRQEFYHIIMRRAKNYGIGVVPNEDIDQIGIKKATHLAMMRAISNANENPDFLLIDAEKLDTELPQMSIIKGDQKSNSIAAASILAKCYRDHLMRSYDEIYPFYDFSQNMGYGTAKHLKALESHGPSPIHRKSFAPVKKYL